MRALLRRVAAHAGKTLFEDAAGFSHPAFDMESRIVQATLGNLVLASVYVPNGGKDYAAKIEFMPRLDRLGAASCTTKGASSSCAATSTSRAPRWTCIRSERKPGVIGQRPEERELFRALLGEHLVDVGRTLDPDNADLFTWWAPWRNMRQRNIGWRLDYVLASPAIAARARELRGAGGRRHQRPRAGNDDYCAVTSSTTRRLGARHSMSARPFSAPQSFAGSVVP